MSSQKSFTHAEYEIQVKKAIFAYKKKEFPSIRATCRFFKISYGTLSRRLNGGISRIQAREQQQFLTNAEELTLIHWIKRYTNTGTPLTYSLLKELAQSIRVARVKFASRQQLDDVNLHPIGQHWVQRFLKRHPLIRSMCTRTLESDRAECATVETANRWFDAIEAQWKEHNYEPHDVWNMDESGFGIGEQLASRVLIHLDKAMQKKMVAGKQEWVSDIECINAAGEALPPLLIFKGKYMNTRWITEDTPKDYFFATSKNGWTSNELGLQWLIKVFEPLTREKAAGRQRLLIADGHGSHVRADFIAHCMENKIDLLILPPHCSHILQPLDLGVFAAFKRYHTVKTEGVSRLSTARISRSEWIQLFSEARKRALTRETIENSWRHAGIWPQNRRRVTKNLPSQSTIANEPPHTPTENVVLDLSLLNSSPPEITELSKSNKRFTDTLRECNDVVSPVKRYAERMTRMCETQNTTIAIMAKQLAEQSELLRKRKRRSNGKRVQLEGISVYSTDNVLKVARDAEAKRKVKRPRGRPRKAPIKISDEEEEDDISSTSSDSFEVESD